jgi:hypothetical protein
MARFGENWEKEFRPQWELNKSQGQVGVAYDPSNKLVGCLIFAKLIFIADHVHCCRLIAKNAEEHHVCRAIIVVEEEYHWMEDNAQFV